MNTTFNVDDEIDRLIDKLTIDLKVKLRKIILKHEKIITKQAVSATKTTSEVSLRRPSSAKGIIERPTPRKKVNIKDSRNDTDDSDY